ncbi:hypothetical protein HPT27_14870 [Permianibacter sp. IMCC34836]|uniref:hypothetical protein n=1 Tax=Permianibacter fluminis TaxID=2738515 RepID=UPI001555902B|nr:hypothetical protein [Permianibacter fluminis]NQD38308.1 hypothetical protein [Permianibacter fluminis]
MLQVLRSLDEISSGYSVFEKDQVLTHDQLNSVSQFLEDQDRLSRVFLLGVGISCGLRAQLQGNRVRVSKGVGVSTDGDLLFFTADAEFDRFKPYDNTAPAYAPFYVGETMLPIQELVRVGTNDSRALPLNQFGAETGQNLNNMVAVFLMESYVKDDDLCSGTDCDNLGKDSIHSGRLLLLRRTDIDALRERLDTLASSALALDQVVIERPVIGTGITTAAQLAASYRSACNTNHSRLLEALTAFYPACRHFAQARFPSDPAPGWRSALSSLNGEFARRDAGIQYYYDFLKDLADTWNAFVELLYGDYTVCCPDIQAFPKHLLLGNLVAGDNADENRTGHYPSPAVSAGKAHLQHALFLLGKLDVLIAAFEVPSGGAIRITPSRYDDNGLEERSVPYYYRSARARELFSNWNYRLSQTGRSNSNYGYHAGEVNPRGSAANPLAAHLAPYPLLRIEGHLGQPVQEVQRNLEAQIRSRNLAITVQSIMVTGNRRELLIKPKFRYTDLHRFHYVLRQDLSLQLDDALKFGNSFRAEVDRAVDQRFVVDDPNGAEGRGIKAVAAAKQGILTERASGLKAKLDKPYNSYQLDNSWQSDMRDTLTVAGEFKHELGNVVKTEFVTPFDGLIGGSSHMLWVDWLDKLILDKDDKAQDRVMFSTFCRLHPGLEHAAGVLRGGSFVLVYDSTGNVVADFMLPYRVEDEDDDEIVEPVLPRPPIRPDWVITSGIKLQPPNYKFVKDWFKADIEPDWGERLTRHTGYFDVFKNTINTMGDVFGNLDRSKLAGVGDLKLSDAFLNLRLQEAELQRQQIDLLREQSLDPSLPESKRSQIEQELDKVELAFANKLEETTRYVADNNLDVNKGGDGYQALLKVQSNANQLKGTQAIEQFNAGVGNVQRDVAGRNPVLGNMLGKFRR